jgi:hypothetical protein
MCPQLPRLSPEYSHKAGLQTVITGMPLQIRPVTRGGHAGPVTMGRIARGPLSWTRPHCGMPSSPVFVWCRSSEGCPCLLCLCLSGGHAAETSSEGWRFCLRSNNRLQTLGHHRERERGGRGRGRLLRGRNQMRQMDQGEGVRAWGGQGAPVARGTD